MKWKKEKRKATLKIEKRYKLASTEISRFASYDLLLTSFTYLFPYVWKPNPANSITSFLVPF